MSDMALLLVGIGLLLLPVCALVQLPAGSVVWHEGEDFTSAPEGMEQTVGEKGPASGGKALFGSALAKKGRQVTYTVNLAQDLKDAKLIFRYARLHWRNNMAAAKIACSLIQEGNKTQHQMTFDHTGGWGADSGREWGLAEFKVGPLKKGTLTLILRAEEDQCDINLDGFFIAPQSFNLASEELVGLNRLNLTSRGYIGIDLVSSAIEQLQFPGFNVIGRGFTPHEHKLTVELLNEKGETAATFFKDETLALMEKSTRLIVPSASIRQLEDGNYTLRVAWDQGRTALNMPFIVLGGLMAECEKKQGEIVSFIKQLKDGKNRATSIVDDLEYAVDYLKNGLILLRSRGGLNQDPASFKAALAYFEKAVQRTAVSFSRDLRAFVRQTDETMRLVNDKKDPYAGRSGDLRRAFYSKATGKLEPYRIYIPALYWQAPKVPVLLTLHGGGGDENEFPDMEDGILQTTMEERGYIMVSPKATSWYQDEGIKDLVQLIELALKEYPKADRTRVYSTGVSRGGFGSYNLATSHPELIRAIACVSGIGGPGQMKNLKDIPCLIIHGGSDGVVPVERAHKAAEELKKLGVTHELKVYPPYGHNYHAEEYMKLTLDYFEKVAR